MSIDRFITLEQAVTTYNLDAEQLTRWANSGTIYAGRLDGRLLLREEDVKRAALGKFGAMPEPRTITLAEAAKRYNIPEGVLRKLAKEGRIRQGVSDGIMLLVEQDVRELARMISRNRFAHLEGKPIRVRQAERKYGISSKTLSRWASEGRITVLRRANQLLELDEADVAYAHLLARTLGMRQGRGVLPDTL